MRAEAQTRIWVLELRPVSPSPSNVDAVCFPRVPLPPPPREKASSTPASCQSPELPMTLGEFDMLREHLCFDLDTVGVHAPQPLASLWLLFSL